MELISDGKPLYLASEGKKSFRLIEDWKFKHDCFTPILVVPEGYKSDLASIPSWIFWWQFGAWNIAAIAHDYIYEHGYLLSDWEARNAWAADSLDASRLPPTPSFQKDGDAPLKYQEEIFARRIPLHLSKKEADFLFYQICLFLGVKPITARLMYWAVRLFGRGAWHF